MLGMMGQVRGARLHPMVGAQHRPEIKQVLAGAPVRIHASSKPCGANTQAQRVRRHQAGGTQRNHQRVG